MIIGIDIGGTAIKIGSFSDDYKLIEKWDMESKGEIAKSIYNRLIIKYNKKDIKGIGVGLPGPVKDNCCSFCPNIDINSAKIYEEFKKITPNVFFGNDANLAALGEAKHSNVSNALFVTIGTGVGSGVIIDGKILEGANGAAGEIGHFNVGSKEKCNCGNIGCLETVASARGILKMAKAKMNVNSCKEVFDLAKKRDQDALAVVQEFGSYLGNALASISVIINPEVIIIGGGVAEAGNILLDVVHNNFKKNCFNVLKNTKFTLAKLGNDAGIYGAAHLVR